MKNIIALSFLCFLMISCEKYLPGSGKGSSKKADIVHFESYDSRAKQNRILAYKNTGNGVLKEIPGSPFFIPVVPDWAILNKFLDVKIRFQFSIRLHQSPRY